MRKAFVLYTSDMKLIDKLTIEQRGWLISAIAAYVSDEPVPPLDDQTDMLYSVIVNQIDRDTERYEKTVERRREAATKRWNMQMHANAGDAVEEAVAEADAVAVAVADKDTRAKRKRNQRPAEQHNYDWKQIDADLLRRQREGLTQ